MLFVSMRSLWLAITTWIRLVRSVVNWHANMCWRFILWTVNITTLPVRALAALHKEKMLERLLREVQGELQNLRWDNKNLEAHLLMSIKKYHLMESMLGDLEDDLDKAIVKIELLETEVEHLKHENFRLREVHNRHIWDPTSKISSMDYDPTGAHDKYPPYEISRHSSNSKSKSATLLEDLPLQKTLWADDKPAGGGPNPTGLVDTPTPLALDQRREVALSQSLFSAMLSLMVGVIIWAAEEPCVPLVMALFTVVGLSSRSVVQLFSTIKNRPASDAVVLLSFNCFILGTFTYPTLPRISQVLSQLSCPHLSGC